MTKLIRDNADFRRELPFVDESLSNTLYQALHTSVRLFGDDAGIGVEEHNDGISVVAGQFNNSKLHSCIILKEHNSGTLFTGQSEQVYPTLITVNNKQITHTFKPAFAETTHKDVIIIQTDGKTVYIEPVSGIPHVSLDRFYYLNFPYYNIYATQLNVDDTILIHEKLITDKENVDALIKSPFGKYYKSTITKLEGSRVLIAELSDGTTISALNDDIVQNISDGYIVPDVRRNHELTKDFQYLSNNQT
jgi:hypothetical protein